MAIGSQSLGGGPSTLAMIRAMMVERTRWVPFDRFRETWSIGQASPGIHLVALAGMLGHQLCGRWGIPVAVAAFVVPSAFLTTLFTAGLEQIERFEVIQWALRGIIPATAGMTLALANFFGKSTARAGRVGVLDWLTVAIAAFFVGAVKWPIVLILAAVAAIMAVQVHRAEERSVRERS